MGSSESKDPQYVFYLLWQKEMREISSSVYHLLKSSRKPSVSVDMLLEQVNSSDEHLEAHLCAMLQSVRGMKQYLFLKSSELKCTIREFGSHPHFSSHSVVQSMNHQISQSLSGKSMMLLPNIVLPNFVSSFCFQKIFTEISCYFPSSDNERPGSRHCRSLLLEERIPELWCPPLPCTALD